MASLVASKGAVATVAAVSAAAPRVAAVAHRESAAAPRELVVAPLWGAHKEPGAAAVAHKEPAVGAKHDSLLIEEGNQNHNADGFGSKAEPKQKKAKKIELSVSDAKVQHEKATAEVDHIIRLLRLCFFFVSRQH